MDRCICPARYRSRQTLEKIASSWALARTGSKDPCIVGGTICKICDNFTAIQCEMLATPQYQIRKDKKAGLLVSPREVTVLSPVNSSQQPAISAHAQQTISKDDSAHAQDLPGGSDNVSSSDFFSKKDFDKLSDQLDEKFSHFEALLSRGNIFAVHSVAENPPVGGRLQRFWETWLSLGSNPRVVSI